MSRINPDAKTITTGVTENTPPENNRTTTQEGSSYREVGPSMWRSITGNQPDPTDIFPEIGPRTENGSTVNNFISQYGRNLEPRLNQGIFGPAAPRVGTPFSVRTGRLSRSEYARYFREVEFPPHATDVIQLVSSDSQELSETIEEARSYYNNYLALYEGRREDAERALSGARLTPYQTRVTNQFVARLNDAIRFVEDQLRSLDAYAAENGIPITGGA